MEYLDIVDENGMPTGEIVLRDTAHKEGIRHRTAHVWVIWKTDVGYDILLQKRSMEKESFPGLYDRIPLFSVLVKIDGTDIHDYIRGNCYPFIWHANEDACGVFVLNQLVFGRRGSSAVFTFAKDGRQFDIRLIRDAPSGIVWHKTDPFPQSNAARRLIVSV